MKTQATTLQRTLPLLAVASWSGMWAGDDLVMAMHPDLGSIAS